jgi:hypothetical protein
MAKYDTPGHVTPSARVQLNHVDLLALKISALACADTPVLAQA